MAGAAQPVWPLAAQGKALEPATAGCPPAFKRMRFGHTPMCICQKIYSMNLSELIETKIKLMGTRKTSGCLLSQGEEAAQEAAEAIEAEPVNPLAAWGRAFDAASAQLASYINPLELYEVSDLRALHDINIIEHDGAIEYEEKCHELSIAALSAVKAGLGSEHANMSHCRLSNKGAHALAHALACNVKIKRLTLQSNHIDGIVGPLCATLWLPASTWDDSQVIMDA